MLRSVLDDVSLIAIGYKYNKRHMLHFVKSENTGDTTEGVPYQMNSQINLGTFISEKYLVLQ